VADIQDRPRTAAASLEPLPAPATLIAKVMAKVKAVARMSEAYCYQEEQTEQTLDGKGNPTKSTVSLYEVIRISGGKVRRLIEVDGKPLSLEAAQKEEAKVQNHLKSIQEAEANPVPPAKGGEIALSVEDLLAVSELGPISRIEHQGHPVLALDFRPREGASPKGTGQRLAAKISGRILVDESTDQVVRAEGRLIESFWVGGGLLGAVVPPSTFTLEQQRVADGLWLPVQGTFTLHARVTFVPVRRRMSFRCYAFRQFVVEAPTLSRAPGDQAQDSEGSSGPAD